MSLLLKLLPYLRSLAFFEFIKGFRTNIAGSITLFTGIVGLVYGQVPVPSGDIITWVTMSPEVAWASITAGLTILGIAGKLTK